MNIAMIVWGQSIIWSSAIIWSSTISPHLTSIVWDT